MKSSIKITLSILIVEDDTFKAQKVIALVANTTDCKITHVKDQIEAQKKLLVEKFDLMILDMYLPTRFGSGDPEKDGGEKILIELESDESYIQPDSIIALTEFEDLQVSFRENFADIGAIKFDVSSKKWEGSVIRAIQRIYKSKLESKTIVYCEGENAKSYNATCIPTFEFRGLADSRAIYLAAKNEKDKFSLRDKDFLTQREMLSLKTQHPNYYFTSYYCFENYIYHPDNIAEACQVKFNKENYIAEITLQKNAKLMTIVQDYKLSRNAYIDLNDSAKVHADKNPEDEIVKALQSDDFETFYPYFDMAGKKDNGHKKSCDKTFLSPLNLNKDILVKTKWFKLQVESIFKTS